MEGKIKYWIDLSDYDLETAEAMLTSKRYLYVGFMCHQTIEKAFKAYFTKLNPNLPHLRIAFPIWQRKVDFMNRFQNHKKILSTKLNLLILKHGTLHTKIDFYIA
jgi:hypothetical protein